jgi:hypothetical protein
VAIENKEKNAHITETAPKNVAKPKDGISATAYIPGSALTRNDIVFIAQTAWDSLIGRSVDWIELDGSVQRSLFDQATDICLRGGPTTAFEVAVSETYASFVAGEITPPPPPVEDPPADELQAWSTFPTGGGDPTPGLLARQVANLNERVMVLEGWEAPKEPKEPKEPKKKEAKA